MSEKTHGNFFFQVSLATDPHWQQFLISAPFQDINLIFPFPVALRLIVIETQWKSLLCMGNTTRRVRSSVQRRQLGTGNQLSEAGMLGKENPITKILVMLLSQALSHLSVSNSHCLHSRISKAEITVTVRRAYTQW